MSATDNTSSFFGEYRNKQKNGLAIMTRFNRALFYFRWWKIRKKGVGSLQRDSVMGSAALFGTKHSMRNESRKKEKGAKESRFGFR